MTASGWSWRTTSSGPGGSGCSDCWTGSRSPPPRRTVPRRSSSLPGNVDVVLMDLKMPVLDGVQATTRIDFPEVAVLVLTTYADDASIATALRAGARVPHQGRGPGRDRATPRPRPGSPRSTRRPKRLIAGPARAARQRQPVSARTVLRRSRADSATRRSPRTCSSVRRPWNAYQQHVRQDRRPPSRGASRYAYRKGIASGRSSAITGR